MRVSYIKCREGVQIGTSVYTSITNNQAELIADFAGRRGITIARPGQEEIFVPFENVSYCRLAMTEAVPFAVQAPTAPMVSKSQQKRLDIQGKGK